jgi:hypothetical protein
MITEYPKRCHCHYQLLPRHFQVLQIDALLTTLGMSPLDGPSYLTNPSRKVLVVCVRPVGVTSYPKALSIHLMLGIP